MRMIDLTIWYTYIRRLVAMTRLKLAVELLRLLCALGCLQNWRHNARQRCCQFRGLLGQTLWTDTLERRLGQTL